MKGESRAGELDTSLLEGIPRQTAEDVFDKLARLPHPAQVRAVSQQAAQRKEVARKAQKARGMRGQVRGHELVCIDAGEGKRVVLEAEDEAADIRAAFPAGELVKVGGHWFKVQGCGRRRVTLIPHGESKAGTIRDVADPTRKLNRAERRRIGIR